MDLGSIAVRAVSTYVFLLLLLRLAGKRAIKEAAAFDFVLALIIGDMIDDAVWSNVPFAQFDSDTRIAAAAADLASYSDYAAPRDGGSITPRVLFRGELPGDLEGPFVSQFLVRDIARYGQQSLSARIRTMEPGSDQANADCRIPFNQCTSTFSTIGISTMNAAPRNDPRMLPMPPMMTMNRMRNDRSSVNASGSTVPR